MKKILPPFLFLFFALLMPFICWGLGLTHYIQFPYNLAGIPFLFLGLGAAKVSKKQFQRLGTNVSTFNQPDILVTDGLFKLTRNPMYLGFAIAIIGLAILYQGALSSFIVALLFIIITDRWYIKFEEKAMTSMFGKEYEDYCKNTRRWI
jgi:protein-S-isoprenylcysteine O-methyltransferase Ste14